MQKIMNASTTPRSQNESVYKSLRKLAQHQIASECVPDDGGQRVEQRPMNDEFLTFRMWMRIAANPLSSMRWNHTA